MTHETTADLKFFPNCNSGEAPVIELTPETVAVMNRCPSCKVAKRVDVEVGVQTDTHSLTGKTKRTRVYIEREFRPGFAVGRDDLGRVSIYCPSGCRHPNGNPVTMNTKTIKGTTTCKECSGRCYLSKSDVCRCACGGENHGKGWR